MSLPKTKAMPRDARRWRLRGMILLLGALTLFAGTMALFERDSMFADKPRVTDVFYGLFLAAVVLNFVTLTLLWREKRLGVVLTIVFAAVVAALECYALEWDPKTLRIPLVLVVLLLLVRPLWREFR